ncbi:SDR family oxidoreductase [Microbacterium pseudoresistens]|uniref:NAD(P)-dependent dehydrogenase (Short-subunit alcohol dehydrogenase family) n=1 Tax=Microbacterium pseudoresistens TaxID=640634 RepID=A0A7Y9JPJ2_9MICO|nr:NAD(P)-dependent dehydrogenase (short-subunit alcohol dehydrogenase family) [Microbacterium pseudoresistens]
MSGDSDPEAPETARPSAIVTGAGTGIGRAVARALLADGFGVTFAGRRPEPLQEAASPDAGANDDALHPNALVVPTDVTDPDAVERLMAQHVARFGRLDVLFNNAGMSGPGVDVGDLDPAEWLQVLAVNVTGSVLCAGAAFRQMRAQDPQGGRIIDNGSIAAQTPRPRSVAYATTKHAIAGLTKSIELDGRPHGITATQLDIGNARTELLDGLVAGGALQADGSVRPEPTMDVAHVAGLVVRLARLPLDVSVPHLTVTAAAMPFLGRG